MLLARYTCYLAKSLRYLVKILVKSLRYLAKYICYLAKSLSYFVKSLRYLAKYTCWALSMDLRNPWIALRKLCTLRGQSRDCAPIAYVYI